MIIKIRSIRCSITKPFYSKLNELIVVTLLNLHDCFFLPPATPTKPGSSEGEGTTPAKSPQPTKQSARYSCTSLYLYVFTILLA